MRGTGFEVIAAIGLGALPFSCGECLEAPAKIRKAVQKERGCTKPSKAAVWESDGKEWYSCPVKFAHSFLHDWVEQYNFAGKFGGMQYDKLPSKWFEAWHTYEAALRRLKPQARSESSGLDDLKAAIHGK